MGKIIQCPVCGNAKDLLLKEKYLDFELYSCAHCELIFTNPMKEPGASFYEDFFDIDSYHWRWCFEQILLKNFHPGGSLLDIGCGNGILLDAARKRGYQVTGLDLNDKGIKKAQEIYGLSEVYPLSVEEFRDRFPEHKFDIVTAFHILEHVEDPSGLVRKLRELIKDDGCLALAVPNQNSWQIKKRRPLGDYPPLHLTRWNQHSLNYLLKSQRFAEIYFAEKYLTLDRPAKVFSYIKELLTLLFSTGLIAKTRFSNISYSMVNVAENKHDQKQSDNLQLIVRTAFYLKRLITPLIAGVIFPFSTFL